MEIISHGSSPAIEAGSDSLTRNPDSEQTRQALEDFELGRFLLANRGLNGFWTSYIVLFPDRGLNSRLSSDGTPLSELEAWILERCPIVLATQERFRSFKRLTQPLLHSSAKAASIPCGLMDDLLTLDYAGLTNVALTGVDLDRDSLDEAAQNYLRLNPPVETKFVLADAWHLPSERWNIITSNGLNIYVQDDEQCTALYRSFAQHLEPGGILVTSFITPPATWLPKSVADLAYQRFLFSEVVAVKWQCVRSEEQTRQQLENAGLGVVTIEYDSQRMFPAIVAQKK